MKQVIIIQIKIEDMIIMRYMIETNFTQLSHLEMDKVKDFIVEVFGNKNIVEIFLQEIGLDHLILQLRLQELDIIG